MEKRNAGPGGGVGVGTILAPGSYKVEGEEMLLRVRVNGSPLLCLIDGERRVREIVACAAAAPEALPAAGGEVAFDARLARESDPCPDPAGDLEAYALGARPLAEKFAALLQRFAGDSRACLRKMADILDPGNARLACEFRAAGPGGLKAYLVREFFKRTVREERGFKVLLFLSHLIAAGEDGQAERLEAMSLERQKQMLKEFMDFLKVPGHKRIDPRIFQEIHDQFGSREYANLSRGGAGFFIKPLYDREMAELKAAIIHEQNSNYIEQLFINSSREPLDFLYENSLAYLKAMAIVRLYARSNRKERGGDSKVVEHIIRDLIHFRPAWIKAAGPLHARTA